jgi:Flp pilus assembly pilin Flp
MVALSRRLMDEESGQAMTEYALIIAAVSVALVTTLYLFRNAIGMVFFNAAEHLDDTQPGFGS